MRYAVGVAMVGFGLVLASATAMAEGPFDEMISPVSMPTVNEDPRITTELRPM